MKYWLFDGGDIIGPFSLRELAGKKGFSSISLVCPDGFSDQADHWQMASTFPELQPILNGEPLPQEETPNANPSQADQTNPPVEIDETPTSGEASLRLPLTPGKAGPIEEYFNTIKGEDLGNILGIPDPNENTDADLARVIANELGPLPEKEVYESFRQPLPEAQNAQEAPKRTEQVAPKQNPQEGSQPKTNAPTKQTEQPKTNAPQKTAGQPKPSAQQPGAQKPNAQSKPNAQKASAQPNKAQQAKPASKPKPTAQPKPKQTAPAGAADLTREPDSPEGIRIIDLDEQQPAAKTTPKPARQTMPKKQPVRSETITKNEVEIEKFDTGRVQEEISAYREPDTQSPTPTEAEEEIVRKPARSQWLMAALACLLLFVLVRILVQENNYLDEISYAAKDFAAEKFPSVFAQKGEPLLSFDNSAAQAQPQEQPLRSVADALVPAAAVLPNEETDLRSPYAEPEGDENTDLAITEGVPLTPAQTALVSVQNYELPNGRGTIKDYLQNYYAPQFNKGYEADWSVSLLHKNTYIVQYRLTKTRTEPIVYVFEADGEKGLLTGALNNITLDLVGKIQQ